MSYDLVVNSHFVSPRWRSSAMTQPAPPSVSGVPPQPSTDPHTFVDRRRNLNSSAPAGFERRQFANSYDELSPDARELAQAIDEYKLHHRRRFITFEEMLGVIHELGYRKQSN